VRRPLTQDQAQRNTQKMPTAADALIVGSAAKLSNDPLKQGSRICKRSTTRRGSLSLYDEKRGAAAFTVHRYR
jgi:hypothetical protein